MEFLNGLSGIICRMPFFVGSSSQRDIISFLESLKPVLLSLALNLSASSFPQQLSISFFIFDLIHSLEILLPFTRLIPLDNETLANLFCLSDFRHLYLALLIESKRSRVCFLKSIV